MIDVTLQVKEYLKENGVHIKFRDQGKRNPPAAGCMSDFYPIENIHSAGKKAIVKFVGESRKWRNGCGAFFLPSWQSSVPFNLK